MFQLVLYKQAWNSTFVELPKAWTKSMCVSRNLMNVHTNSISGVDCLQNACVSNVSDPKSIVSKCSSEFNILKCFLKMSFVHLFN